MFDLARAMVETFQGTLETAFRNSDISHLDALKPAVIFIWHEYKVQISVNVQLSRLWNYKKSIRTLHWSSSYLIRLRKEFNSETFEPAARFSVSSNLLKLSYRSNSNRHGHFTVELTQNSKFKFSLPPVRIRIDMDTLLCNWLKTQNSSFLSTRDKYID
jgi:hypothetical protein